MPSETPETVKKSVHKNPVWMPVLLTGAAILFWSLTAFDAAIPYTLQLFTLETNGWAEGCFYLAIVAAFFGIQWGLLRLRRFKWIAWLPILLVAVGLVYSEVSWSGGGFGDRIFGNLICIALLPAYLGISIAALAAPLLRQKPVVKRIALVCVAVALAAAFWLWPRPLSKMMEFAPGQYLLYFDKTGEYERKEITDPPLLKDNLRWAKASPCYTAPGWREERGLLVRLNSRYVLRAPHAGTPYLYEYSGPLENFDGASPRFILWGYYALYTNLRGVTDWN